MSTWGRGRGRGAVAVLPGPGCRFPRGYGALAALPRPVGRGLVASWPRRPWCSGGLISRGPRGRGALATLPGPVGHGRGRHGALAALHVDAHPKHVKYNSYHIIVHLQSPQSTTASWATTN
ncbi:hypothetical protein Tco_0938008 [Tanacetum coccineum]|uniref:Uncharacterized protein n=1 Tax=Tanacetum coccineum TaxID=301880 RepID=A0ABQ5DIM4_9ASTR